jgi:hypothetical protein
MHAYMNTYRHTYIPAHGTDVIQHGRERESHMHTYIHTCIHTDIHTYLPTALMSLSMGERERVTYIHAYIHAYIQTYIPAHGTDVIEHGRVFRQRPALNLPDELHTMIVVEPLFLLFFVSDPNLILSFLTFVILTTSKEHAHFQVVKMTSINVLGCCERLMQTKVWDCLMQTQFWDGLLMLTKFRLTQTKFWDCLL